jgi:hypothetical protein
LGIMGAAHALSQGLAVAAGRTPVGRPLKILSCLGVLLGESFTAANPNN